MPTASSAVASLTDDTTIHSTINSTVMSKDEDKDNGRLALTTTIE